VGEVEFAVVEAQYAAIGQIRLRSRDLIMADNSQFKVLSGQE
jgi:hypothetical protein